MAYDQEVIIDKCLLKKTSFEVFIVPITGGKQIEKNIQPLVEHLPTEIARIWSFRFWAAVSGLGAQRLASE